MEATKRVQQEEEISGLVLTYRVNDTLLCVPVEHVESVIEPPAITELPHAPDYVIGAFMHRGQTALALSLRKLLKLPPATNKQRKESLLVIWMGDHPVGYWVDEIKGMTDSGRGHWSAVPALIRDQGITRALVCDGQVYFPIDLTHSRQFKEISRALEAFEKSRLQSVTDEVAEDVIEPPHVEQATHQKPAQQKLDTPEENLLTEPDAELVDGQTVTEDEPVPTEDALLDAAEVESIEEQADTIDELSSDDEEGSLEPEQHGETPDSEAAVIAEDDDYTVADYPADNTLEEGYEEQIEATAFAEHEIDTSALARAMHAAQGGVAEVIPLHQPPEVQFDANGQGDAFYELIAETEAKYGPVQAIEDISDAISSEDFVTEGQVDAFEEAYQALLSQDIIDADIDEPDASEQDYITARESLDDFTPMDELSLTEEPYSFLPAALPEDDEQALLDEVIDEAVVDEDATDAVDTLQMAELRQSEIDAVFRGDEDIIDELSGEETVSDELSLTEEPYSFLPTTLPEDDEQALLDEVIDEIVVDEDATDAMDTVQLAELHQSEIDTVFSEDEDVIDELSGEESVSDELSLTEEPYSFLPASLPEDDVSDEQALLDETEVDESMSDDLSLTEELHSFIPASLPEDEIGDVVIEPEESPAQQNQPVMLLPHLSDETADRVKTDDVSISTDSNVSERPVIALPHETDKIASLPEFDSVISKADFYTDKIADLLKETLVEAKSADNSSKNIEIETPTLPLEDKPKDQISADIYELKIPQVSPQEETSEPAPSLGKKHITPQLDRAGVIIRPDGQINKSFGLVKLFTIILATSAAGSWWFRDELFYKEQIRKEIPSILQNEIAFLYSNRVTIVSPKKGAERMIVDTPEQEITVIRRKHVSRALLRESGKKSVKIHRVRKGDTLWAIASLYLDDPYRYPELAENNRIHDPDLIRPGDVVKITTKKPSADKS